MVLAGLITCAQAAPERDPYKYFFDQSLGDFTEELARAKAEGKQGVMLFFEMDDCPFCHRMKTTVLNQPEVQAYYRKHFLSFPVDVEGDVEITDFQGRTYTEKTFAEKVNRVRATPVFAFYDLNGRQVARYTGATFRRCGVHAAGRVRGRRPLQGNALHEVQTREAGSATITMRPLLSAAAREGCGGCWGRWCWDRRCRWRAQKISPLPCPIR